MLETLISNWIKNPFYLKMETFVYYMAVLLLVAVDNIIMVKDVVWRFVGEEGSSVWVKEYHNIMS